MYAAFDAAPELTSRHLAATGLLSASRRILTICSSLNRLFFMASSPQKPFSQISTGPKIPRQVTRMRALSGFGLLLVSLL